MTFPGRVVILFATFALTTMACADRPAVLTIDTPILDLLDDPRTRPIVERHLPRLSARLLEDPSAAEFLGSSSPRELSADSHVRGITEEILQRLQADLLAAQTAESSSP